MRSMFLVQLFFCFFGMGCDIQAQLNQIKYVGYSYKSSLNKSFVTKQLKFLNGNDSLFINVRLPFDTYNQRIIDEGVFYSCHLKLDSVYNLKIKKVTPEQIPTEWNSYYRTNAVFADDKNRSRFKEIKKDTRFIYKGNPGKFIDIKGELYEITSVLPPSDCQLQH